MGMESGKSDRMLQIATPMKESMRWTKRTAWVPSPGKAATFIRAATGRTKDTGTVKCTGLTEAVTKENGRTASNTELERWSSLTDVSKRATLKTMSIRSQSRMHPSSSK
jgi:hypothetical protein